MKKTILFFTLTVVTVIYFNCSSENTTNYIPGITALTSISGTAENWQIGSQIIKLRLVGWRVPFGDTVVATSTINSNGSFSFDNLPTISNNILGLVTFPNDSMCSGNVTVNPSGLYAGITFIDVYTATDSNLGTLTRANAPYFNVQTYYSYFSNAGSVSGNYSCNFGGFLSDEAYSINFPAKWYYIVVKTDILDTNHIKFTYNNTEPSGMKWYFQSSFENDETPSLENRKRKIVNQLIIK